MELKVKFDPEILEKRITEAVMTKEVTHALEEAIKKRLASTTFTEALVKRKVKEVLTDAIGEKLKEEQFVGLVMQHTRAFVQDRLTYEFVSEVMDTLWRQSTRR